MCKKKFTDSQNYKKSGFSNTLQHTGQNNAPSSIMTKQSLTYINIF